MRYYHRLVHDRFLTIAFVVTVAVTLMLLSACGAAAPAAAELDPSTAATVDAVVDAASNLLDTADRLNGRWQSEDGAANYLFDLDGGEITLSTGGGETSFPAVLDRVEGQTVYVRITGPNGDRVDSYRFINENIVAWEQDGQLVRRLERVR